MDDISEKKMLDEVNELFPDLFSGRYSCHWGQGWHPIICNMFAQLKMIDVQIEYIKEKFSELRVGLSSQNGISYDTRVSAMNLIDKYTVYLRTVCYDCGSPGKREVIKGYVIVQCAGCKKNREK